MFCPSCSSPTAEGAKFCKSCGLSLTVVTQALNGSPVTSDPIREREYKRARRQVSDGIQGAAIGAALLMGAAVAYLLLPKDGIFYAVSLGLALAGLIKLFRSIGHVVDAKVGPRLLEKSGQVTRATGNLAPQPAPTGLGTTRVSQRLSVDVTKHGQTPKELPQPEKVETPAWSQSPGSESPGSQSPGTPIGTTRVGTSRVGREQSSPLRKSEKGQDVLSRLRN